METFLDTPVKRYSSGMYVRLAFAVAAHLEPEILDRRRGARGRATREFQKKCLGQDAARSQPGRRTVLFVSHNMNAVENLCTTALCLESGGVKAHGGDVRGVITGHLGAASGTGPPQASG